MYDSTYQEMLDLYPVETRSQMVLFVFVVYFSLVEHDWYEITLEDGGCLVRDGTGRKTMIVDEVFLHHTKTWLEYFDAKAIYIKYNQGFLRFDSDHSDRIYEAIFVDKFCLRIDYCSRETIELANQLDSLDFKILDANLQLGVYNLRPPFTTITEDESGIQEHIRELLNDYHLYL